MRKIFVKQGIQERMNSLLGTEVAGSSPPDINDWSIQSRMIGNIRTVAAGVCVADVGRILSDLNMTYASPNLTIYPGVAITKSGYVINLQDTLTFDISTFDDPSYFFLKYVLQKVNATHSPHSSGIIGGVDEIIEYDEYCVAEKGNSSGIESNVMVHTATGTLPDDDHVYIGTYGSGSGLATADIEFSDINHRAVFGGSLYVSGSQSNIECANGNIKATIGDVEAGVRFIAQSTDGLLDETRVVKDGASVSQTVTIKGGIITGWTT